MSVPLAVDESVGVERTDVGMIRYFSSEVLFAEVTFFLVFVSVSSVRISWTISNVFSHVLFDLVTAKWAFVPSIRRGPWIP